MTMQVLVVQPENESIPKDTAQQLTQIGCVVSSVGDYDSAIDILKDKSFGAVLLSEPHLKTCTPEHQVAFELFVKQIEAKRIATILYSKEVVKPLVPEESLVEHVNSNISAPELTGRIAMIQRYHGMIGRLETQLQRMEQLGKLLNQHLRELDHEMELAGRLQQDFLPPMTGQVGNIAYAGMFRPVTWISGDMFDVLHIDETHTGFYIADAVGHGMASGLLAMYMKRAIVPAKIHRDQVIIIRPTEVLEALNRAMVDQALPDCQFITACYALFNHQTRTLEFARAGHPHPILIKKNGEVKELSTPGGLLGLSQNENYPSIRVPLEIGDKVVVFTDGFEPFLTLDAGGNVGDRTHLEMFKPMSSMSIYDVVSHMESLIDMDGSWNKPPDDMTILGFEVLP